jgi:hypothetical protein
MPGAAPSTRRCTSLACVHLTAALSRCDQQTRVAVHSWRTAPIRCSASVSISSCITIRTDARLRSTPSPGGLAHLRGDWVGKEILGSTQPIWRHDASTFQGGRRIKQLAAEAVVRAARALKRWAAIDVEKQTECHGDQTYAPRHSGGPARLGSKELRIRWSVFKAGVNKPHSLDRDDVFGGRAPWIARLGRRSPPHRWGARPLYQNLPT